MENKTRSIVWKVLLAVVAVSVVGIGTALVQENKSNDEENILDTRYVWTAPTVGTPVDHYLVQVLVNEVKTEDHGPVSSPEITVPLKRGNKYQIRVAAVDASGAQGPWSIWSELYNPELASPAPPE